MMIRFLFLASSFFSAVSGQAVAPPDGCLICGDGKVVTDPDAIFEFPDQPSTPCGVLQSAGLQGIIPLDQCEFLPPLIGICQCELGNLPPTPVPCPEAPDEGCSICGAGLCVTNPDSIFSFPGQPSVPCGQLQDAGFLGLIPLDSCPLLPELVIETCACRASVSMAPTSSPTVTSCPDVPDGGCSVCGSGLCVNNPDAVFSFPGQPSASCGAIEGAGLAGIIPLDQCQFLPDLLLESCSCRSSILGKATVSPSSSPTNSPTGAPTQTPSNTPTGNPTSAPITTTPSPAPTDAPSKDPTAMPTNFPISPPTSSPIVPPTDAPTEAPIVPPTQVPVVPPTAAPAIPPTTAPSIPLTTAPSFPPTKAPVVPLTSAPKPSPTDAPHPAPSKVPTRKGGKMGMMGKMKKTASPSAAPSSPPSSSPSFFPSVTPTKAFKMGMPMGMSGGMGKK